MKWVNEDLMKLNVVNPRMHDVGGAVPDRVLIDQAIQTRVSRALNCRQKTGKPLRKITCCQAASKKQRSTDFQQTFGQRGAKGAGLEKKKLRLRLVRGNGAYKHGYSSSGPSRMERR